MSTLGFLVKGSRVPDPAISPSAAVLGRLGLELFFSAVMEDLTDREETIIDLDDSITSNPNNSREDAKDIEKVFNDYYHGMFTSDANLDMENVLDAVENKMSENACETLSRPFVEEDVTVALAQMHPTKAPGPDRLERALLIGYRKDDPDSISCSSHNILPDEWKILRGGIQWNIGDGERVDIWDDPWLSDCPSFRIQSRPPTDMTISRVRELIRSDIRAWDESLVTQLFIPSEARSIKAIPLCINQKDDKVVWHHTKYGKYTVKSGYKVATNLKENEDRSPASSGNNTGLWRWVWALSISNKVKVFLWKCIYGILPTKGALIRRGVVIDGFCSWCGQEVESNEHAVRDCLWMEFLWVVSPLRLTLPIESSRGTLGD
ncbi:hypothetical protein DH2020_016984 [Rehmannia glutinosa]|uniref:Reverse transcriptase zinc-binding domain-containing protein n=1 Tax=Rehmannia glutinosa TaxID=99300 RepID=A0ABR0WT22_REHGL